MNFDGASLAVILLAVMVTGVVIVLYRRQSRQRRIGRGSIFQPAYDLFDSYRVVQQGDDFPVLTGRYRDQDFHIDTVIDTLTFRKLPVLWLRVSLLRVLPGMAATDIMVRVQNNEFYAPANNLAFQLDVPSHWPPGMMVKTDDPGRAPSIAQIERHIAFFDLPEAKEMLLTSKGIRLVRMLDQGTRAEYLVMRAADFRATQTPADMMRNLMDRCILLADDQTGAA